MKKEKRKDEECREWITATESAILGKRRHNGRISYSVGGANKPVQKGETKNVWSRSLMQVMFEKIVRKQPK